MTLVVAVQAMGIQRYIFCSIHNCEAFPLVPLMQIKSCTEDFLKTSSLDYTILRLCGFHQAIIGSYAVWLPSCSTFLRPLSRLLSPPGMRQHGPCTTSGQLHSHLHLSTSMHISRYSNLWPGNGENNLL